MTFIKNNSYLVIALVLILMFSFITIQKLEQEVAYEQIIVTEGDTLWAYSQKYAQGIPAEEWIGEVIRVNELPSTTIKTGETLRIPAISDKIEHNHIATNVVEETE